MIRLLAIESALKKSAPDSIPRSGKKAETVNCYVIELVNFDTNQKFLIKDVLDKGVTGIFWDNNHLGHDACLLKSEIDNNWKLEITHYYKTWETLYHDEIDYFFGKLIQWHLIVRFTNGILQYLFNKKTLRRSERIELLNYLIEETINDPNYVFSATLLGQRLYSRRWVSHPNWQQSNAHLKLILGSLIASGDLKKQDTGYKIEPKALSTISEYENDERKHLDIINNARFTRWLTVALVTVGIANVLVRLWK